MTQILHDCQTGKDPYVLYQRQVMLTTGKGETTIVSLTAPSPGLAPHKALGIKLTFVNHEGNRSINLEGEEIELMRQAIAEYDRWQVELAATTEP